MTSVLFTAVKLMGWLVGVGGAIWAVGAVYFDFPRVALRAAGAVALGLAFVVAVTSLGGDWRALAVLLGGTLAVRAWWLTQKPSNTRDWQPNVERLAWAQVDGDVVTLHNVRHCEYRALNDYTPRWETRTVALSHLTGLDLALTHLGSPWIAHVIASFQFADAPPVCFSIEVRMEVGETYSPLAGLYRRFELIYVVADERDVLRVRTNFRDRQDVYLYRTAATPAHARALFLEYLGALNALRDRPRWYHTITANCLTSIRSQSDSAPLRRWDWRLLLPGKFDELLYARGGLVTGGLSFAELKARSLINPAARAAGDDPDFSDRIRAGRVWNGLKG